MKVTLKTLRQRSGMTQYDVANDLKISMSTVKRWEEYETFPDYLSCIRLCELFDCHIDEIFFPDKLAENEEQKKINYTNQ